MTHSEWKHYNDVDPKEWKWPNFQPAELATRGGPNAGSLKVDITAMNCLQALRDKVGPMIVTSAYRDPAWNAHVGGKRNSQHLLGKAFDISMANHNPEQFVSHAKACGFHGIGYYEEQGFIHIDTGPSRTWGKPWKAKQFEPEVDKSVTKAAKNEGMAGIGVSIAAQGAKEVIPIVEQAAAVPGWVGHALSIIAIVALLVGGYLLYKKLTGRKRA